MMKPVAFAFALTLALSLHVPAGIADTCEQDGPARFCRGDSDSTPSANGDSATTDISGNITGTHVGDFTHGNQGAGGGNGVRATETEPGGHGGAGGNGGDFAVDASGLNGPSLTLWSVGGPGGDGGQHLGDGINAQPAGDGGTGGNAGDIDYTDSATTKVTQLNVYSLGGRGGSTGLGGTGGDGGDGGDLNFTLGGTYGGVIIESHGGSGPAGDAWGTQGGDGGDIVVVFDGTAANLNIASRAGSPGEKYGEFGAPGAVSLDLSGTVAGDVRVTSSGGTGGEVSVRLLDGASVGGTIFGAYDGEAELALALAFTFKNNRSLAAARASLEGNAESGSITVKGETYRWSSFTTLLDQMEVLRKKHPSARITVKVDAPKPSKLHCDSPKVTALLEADGTIKISARTGITRRSIGSITKGAFSPAGNSGWSAAVASEVPTLRIAIYDASGKSIAECATKRR